MKCIKLLSLILAILFFTACGNQGKVAKPLDSSSSVSSKKSSSNSSTFYSSKETSSDSVSSSSSASKSQEGPQVQETEEGALQLRHRLEVPMQVQRSMEYLCSNDCQHDVSLSGNRYIARTIS